MDDLSRNVELSCPTCGCTQFAYETPESGSDFTDDWPFTCAHCGRTYTRAELIDLNRESIDATIEDMGNEITAALGKELEKQFKKIRW